VVQMCHQHVLTNVSIYRHVLTNVSIYRHVFNTFKQVNLTESVPNKRNPLLTIISPYPTTQLSSMA